MDVPLSITASVLIVAAFAVLALPIVINRFTPGPAGPGVGLLLGVWVVATALLAGTGAYRTVSQAGVPPIGIALMVALAGVALAVVVFPALQVVLVDPAAQPWLLALQVWRIEGVAFLVLFALGQLPALFALPAGIGDLAIGVTAPLVARNLHRRNLALAWNVLGLADLVVAVSLGVMTNPGPLLLFATTPTSDVLTAFPMALVPTFLVPLSVGLHVASLRQLLTANASQSRAPLLAAR
jgi:hypothetical protein